MRFFWVFDGFICAGGYLEKEEFVSMHGGCEEKAGGQTRGGGSPETIFAEGPVIENFWNREKI